MDQRTEFIVIPCVVPLIHKLTELEGALKIILFSFLLLQMKELRLTQLGNGKAESKSHVLSTIPSYVSISK